MAKATGNREIVGYKNHGKAQLLLEVAQQSQYVGLHFCMGAQLARAELMTTFQRLLSHVQHLSLDEDAGGYDYFPSVFFHGLEKLHVKFA